MVLSVPEQVSSDIWILFEDFPERGLILLASSSDDTPENFFSVEISSCKYRRKFEDGASLMLIVPIRCSDAMELTFSIFPGLRILSDGKWTNIPNNILIPMIESEVFLEISGREDELVSKMYTVWIEMSKEASWTRKSLIHPIIPMDIEYELAMWRFPEEGKNTHDDIISFSIEVESNPSTRSINKCTLKKISIHLIE